MVQHKEIRIAGASSHGVIEAGLILQEAAAIYDDLNAHHVQSYGPEARGEAARSEVIISDGEIDYPKVTQLDAMVATTQVAADRYRSDLRSEGLLLVEKDVVVEDSAASRVFRLPLLETASKEGGRKDLLHVVALGALVEATQIVTKPAIEAAVRDHAPRGDEEVYRKALSAGYALAS